MKKNYLLFAFLILTAAAHAYTASQYVFSRSTGSTFTSISGSTGVVSTTGLSSDDQTQTGIPIGFSFVFCGTTYTTLSACSNGWLSLANSGSTAFTNAATNIVSAGMLMPFWFDLDGTGKTAYYITTGTAPNRVFTFQFGTTSAGWGTYGGAGSGCFQVKLYESSNVIQYAYSSKTYNSSTGTVGIANSTSDYLAITSTTSTTASSTTFTASLASTPANGVVLTFTPPPTLSISPSSLTFITATGSTSAAQNVTLTGYGLTSGSVTVTPPSSFKASNGTTYFTSAFTLPTSTSATGSNYINTTVPVEFVAPATSGTTLGNLTFASTGATTQTVTVTGNATTPCTGTPTAGTDAVSPTFGNGSTTFTLTATGYSVAGGITFQWQKSTTSDTSGFANISGATTASYTYSAGITANTWFRCVVRCTASSSSANGTAIGVNYLAASSCTPSYNTTYSCGDGISVATTGYPFQLTGASGSINDATACSSSTDYIDQTSAGYTCTLNAGSTYSITLGANVSGNTVSSQVWIDFNNDGIFQASESVGGSGTTAWTTTTKTFSIVIPPGSVVSAGTFRMRVANVFYTTGLGAMYNKKYPNILACPTSSTEAEGEIRDYAVTINVVPCSGTPSGGTTTATTLGGCSSYSSTLSLTGASVTSGLTYQWQSSPDNTTWTNVAGATSYTYTATVSSITYYQCIVTCTASASSANSSSLRLNYTPAITGVVSSFCQNTNDTLADATSGGTWTSSSPTVASVTTAGVVTGVSGGSATISYATTGCTQTAAVTVTPLPSAITGTTTICNGASTTLSDAVTGGSWSSTNASVATVDPSSGIVTGVGVGTSTISYTTGCGSVSTAFTVNTEPAAIEGTFGMCISSSNTLTDATSSGVWSITGSAAGTTIDPSLGTITSSTTTGTETVYYAVGSCSVSATVNVGNSSPAAITGTLTACAGASTTLADATSGGSWSSSNTAIATVNSGTGAVTGVSAGTAVISYNSGCGTPPYSVATYTVTGSALALSYSSAGLTGPVCSGSSLQLNSGTSAGGTYSWSGPNSFTSAAANPTISSVSTAASGVYTFTGTFSGCGAVTGNLFVAVDAVPTVSATVSNATICTGGTSTLTATVPAPATTSYELYAIPYQSFATSGSSIALGDDGAVATALPFSFNFYGTSYSTVNIGQNGYVNFGTRVTSGDYTPYALPSTSAPKGLISLFWADLKDNITGGGSITYTTVGSAPNRQFVISYNNVAGYDIGTATANYNNGQIVLYEGTNVIEVYVTSANIGSAHTPVCGIQNIAGTSAVTVPGENAQSYSIASPTGWRFAYPSYNYTWSPSTDLSSTSIAATVSSGLTATQVYTVTTVDANSGCTTGKTATATVNVVAQPSVTLAASPTTLCSGGNETLVATPTGGTGTKTYTWSGPGIVTNTGTTAVPAAYTPTVTTTTTGAYSVAVAYTGSGCSTANGTSAAVTIYPQPSVTSVTPSTTSICSGGTVTLTAPETGGTGAPVYTWNGPGLATTTSTSSPLVFTPTVTTTTAGAYSVSVSDAGAGCSGSAVVTSSVVTVNSQPVVNLGASPLQLCNGGTLALSSAVTGGSGTATYTWSGPGISTTTGTTVSSTYTPTVSSGSYSVSVNYSDPSCNVATGTSSVVTVSDQPSVSIMPSSTTLCNGTTETLTATITDGGAGTPSYTWSGPGISGSAGPYVASTYTVAPAAGTTPAAYTVAVTYPVSAGCNTATNNTAVVTPTSQQWQGATSANWSDATNWACGTIPAATEDVIIPGSSTYTNPPTLDVATGYTQKLTINATATLTLNSGNQLDVAGNLANNGAITGTGVVYLNGSSAQTISGTGTINNLTLSNSAGAAISSTSDTVSIAGTLLLNSGTFTTGGTLMLVSNSSGSGSIGTITGGTLSGNVIVQQYIPAGRRAYRFIAHPFSTSISLSQIEPYIDITGQGGSANGFTTTTSNAPSAYWYNPIYGNSDSGSDPGWRPFTSANGTPDSNMVHRYEGLRLFFRGSKGEGLSGASYTIDAATYRTYGTVNTGSLSMPMVKGGTYGDYNLLGNPYPAVTDIGTVIHNASTSGLITGAAFYVWNPYMGTSGQFITETIGSAYYMGANESFEVRTAANGNALSFSESNKGTTPTNALMRNASNDYVTLYVYDSSYHPWDVLNVKFDDAATDNEDAKYDGVKPPSPASLNFYSWSADNSKLALDVRPFAADKVIPLGITSSYVQDFIIKAENIALPAGGQLYLHDKYLQTYTQLHQGTEYKFTISKDAASQGDQRFELKTSPAGSKATAATSLDVQMVPNPATSDVTIYYTAKGKEQTSIRVLNVEGVTVLSQDLGVQQSGSVKLAVDKLAAGVYMVELTSGANKVISRLVKE